MIAAAVGAEQAWSAVRGRRASHRCVFDSTTGLSFSSCGASVRQCAAWCEESQICHIRNLTTWRAPRLTWRETPLGPCKAGGGATGSGPRVRLLPSMRSAELTN